MFRPLKSPYLPHVLYSMALSSLSIHLMFQREMEDEQRARLTAQTTILSSIVDQLRAPSDKPMPKAELDRLYRLYKVQATENKEEEVMTWRQVFFGRKRPKDGEAEVISSWEQADWNERELHSYILVISNCRHSKERIRDGDGDEVRTRIMALRYTYHKSSQRVLCT